jgi:ABC-type uncharacterized transport system permease subunit
VSQGIDQGVLVRSSPPARVGEAAWLRRTLTAVGPALIGVALALLVGAGLIWLAGADPLLAYRTMVTGAFGGRRQITETVLKACPLLIIGLGLSVAFRSRVWNIGAEGQYFIGALFGSVVALGLPNLPKAALVPLILVAGLVGGALWALPAALLGTRRGISEIISTLMFNYIAILLVQYLARGPLQDPDGFLPESAMFSEAARLPILIAPRIHLGVALALMLAPLVYGLIWRTPLGFRLRALGSNPKAAQFAGINIERGIWAALLISGALAGLAGVIEVTSLHMRLKGSISGGYGFTGILVALLGRLHPLGVVVASLFFAALTIGAEAMHTVSQLPAALAQAIQALVVLFVLGTDAFFRLRRS